MNLANEIRRFNLIRTIDVSGISGEGIIACGVVFPDGHAVLRWFTQWHSTGVYNSIEDLIEIHGHNGATEMEFIDD